MIFIVFVIQIYNIDDKMICFWIVDINTYVVY